MRSKRGVLVGVCRPVPDGGTFVIPVFRTDRGKHVTQSVAEGWIVGFEEICFAEEFVPLNSDIRVTVGDVALCAIELNDSIYIGRAPSLVTTRRGSLSAQLCLFRRQKTRPIPGHDTFDAIALEDAPTSVHETLGAAQSESPPNERCDDRLPSVLRDFGQALELRASIQPGGHRHSMKNHRAFTLGMRAMAAALILAVGVALVSSYMTSAHVITTPPGKLHHHRLPDGTIIVLDARSRIEVDYNDEARIVYVYQGGAVFEVAKDPKRPFVARTHLVDATAVGTRFGISISPGVTTTVAEGVVKVTARGKANEPAVILKAGEELRVADGSLTSPHLAQVDAERKLQWCRGLLVLDGMTVAEAVEQLNRRNELQIVVDSPALAARIVPFISVQVDEPERYAKFIDSQPGVKFRLDKENNVIHLSE
jgi:transmembrane sensor